MQLFLEQQGIYPVRVIPRNSSADIVAMAFIEGQRIYIVHGRLKTNFPAVPHLQCVFRRFKQLRSHPVPARRLPDVEGDDVACIRTVLSNQKAEYPVRLFLIFCRFLLQFELGNNRKRLRTPNIRLQLELRVCDPAGETRLVDLPQPTKIVRPKTAYCESHRFFLKANLEAATSFVQSNTCSSAGKLKKYTSKTLPVYTPKSYHSHLRGLWCV